MRLVEEEDRLLSFPAFLAAGLGGRAKALYLIVSR